MEEAMGKFDRLLRILYSLATPGGCTSRRLSEITGVDMRTIQRDLQFLSDRCFHITQDRKHGPYRLQRDSQLKSDELICIVTESSVSRLINAVSRRRRVRFRYHGLNRLVDPHQLTLVHEQWRLSGFDHGQQSISEFTTRKIESLEVTEFTF